ncbi:putative ABC transport system permease protein [Micromonospora nigra]|uniref:Putative ABC transport system permease protein n=1 Tax=Micromonospora nigra TaxID=145857 RepID=A0A1C6SM68_9ACTN|nr:ABC transporter permease [Micromonospora nigra]SCL30493.1 putative ABC transport system permease protein [Micromonospora nigra]
MSADRLHARPATAPRGAAPAATGAAGGPPERPWWTDRLAGWTGSWRTALRVARREARRARGRTALVLAMITLPVLALTFVAVSLDMAELTTAERVDRQLGSADAELFVVAGGPVVQDAHADNWNHLGEQPRTRNGGSEEQLTALLPAGSRILRLQRWGSFAARMSDRVDDTVPARTVDLTDPLARGLARVHAGRVPAGAGEIAANPAALRRLRVATGDTVTAGDGSRTWTVVGVVEFPDRLDPLVTLHPDGTVPGRAAEVSWLVDLPGPAGPEVFRRLNDGGVVMTARTPAPPRPGASADTWRTDGSNVTQLSSAVLVGGLGLLEVVLLVGPAFAVGVRRRRRDLALVAVAGGDSAHLRRVVLADGVVLGGVGAAAGVALGIVGAFAARPLVEEFVFESRFGGYRVWPQALAVIAAVAVLAGVLAALAPALTAARQDVVAGLAGRRNPPRHRRRWLVVGVVLAAGGAAVAALGAVRTNQPVILTGLILGELGLVFATPTLVGLLARLGRFLPLAPRIALRDASRNRSSTAPAISAVMAAVAGSVALGVFLASDDARAEARYPPQLPSGTVLVTSAAPDGSGSSLTFAQVAGPAREHLGATALVPLVAADCPDGPEDECTVGAALPPDRACPYTPDAVSPRDQLRARADERCRRGWQDHFGTPFQAVVDDGSALPVLTGADPADVAAATAVLRAGGAVATDPRYLVDGRLQLDVTPAGEGQSPTRSAVVPGYALRTGLSTDWLLLSPAAAERLDLSARPLGWAIAADGVPDRPHQERFVSALRAAEEVSLQTDHWLPSDDGPQVLLLLTAVSGVVTVGAAGTATGLAAAEGRADLSTLAAVGAGPGVRRLLSLCQAGVIAVLGSLLGIVAGLTSALIILVAANRRYAVTWPFEPPYPLLVPWAVLGALAVVPLVAMLGAGLFTRSRLPVERRLD